VSQPAVSPFFSPSYNNQNSPCSGMFIEEKEWIKAGVDGSKGDLKCPKKQCSINIGFFNYCGVRCKCGKNMSPGFLVYYDRISKK